MGRKKKIVLKRISGPKKLGLKKFGPRTFWSTKIMTPKKCVLEILVKIGPLVAEIFLIWTIVTRAYIA